MEGVGDDGGVDAGVEEGLALFEEGASDDDHGRGAVSGDDVLGFRELDEHLGGGLEDFHFIKDGGTVVGDDDFTGGGGDHLVHTFGAEAGADGIRHGSGGGDVGHADVIFALVVYVAFCF